MSLTAPQPVKQFSYAIFAPKNLDDPDFLPDQIGANLPAIGHIYTNGASQMVEAFARENGIPCTTFPLCHSNLLTSTNLIMEKVDAAYVVASAESKSAAQIIGLLDKRGIGYKVLPFEASTHWKEKVLRAQEILAALPKGELDENWKTTIEALRKAL
ncbi:MAG: hypothetical protein WCV82_03900 [Candidatus Paceibacterota bacterium]